MSGPLRWGLVGLGGFAEKNIVPAIIASSGSRLVACSGRSLEKSKQFAARLGIPRVHASHDELVLDAEVDAVFVATPNTLHDPVVLAAARAKKHVFCEKPMTMSVPAARIMADACRTAGVALKIGFHMRFEEIVGRVRDLIAAGTIGEVRSIALERTAPTDQPGAWRQNPAEGGGILYDVAVHLLDTVQWISDARITEVFARSHPDAREGKANNSIAISALLGSGCHASVRASRETPHARNDLVVQGALGMIATSSLRWVDNYVLTVTTAAGVREEPFTATPTYTREIEAFERAAAGDSTHLASDEDGIAIVAVTQAILASLESRCSVTV